MRVLVLCEYASLNGGERSLLEVLKRLPSDDYQLLVAAPTSGPLADALRQLELEQVPFDVVEPARHRASQSQLRQRLASLIQQTAPALVHANSVSMSRLSGPVTRELHVPSIGHLRDIVGVSRQALADLEAHGRLLAVSAATRQWYLAAGMTASKIDVLYNGVDVETFCSRPRQGYVHRELEITRDCRLIGTIGQIGVRKGTDLFVAAAGEVARLDSNVHFLIIGRRYSQKAEALEFERALHDQVATGVLAGRLHFLGVRTDVPCLLSELTLYVHAARQEPLGRVLLEAGAAETAIVATDVGGTREIYPHELVAAEVVPAGSSDAIACAMCELLSDETKRLRLGQCARRRVSATFGAERATRGLAAHYQQIASAGARRM